MKIKVILSPLLIGVILLSTYTAIAIAEPTQNRPTIDILKNEAVGQLKDSRNIAISHDSKLEEILWESPSLSKEVLVAKTLGNSQIIIYQFSPTGFTY